MNEYITKEQAIQCVEETKESIQSVTQLTKDYHSVNIICTNIIGNISMLETDTVTNISDGDNDLPEFKCSGCGVCIGEYVEHVYYKDADEAEANGAYEGDYERFQYTPKFCPECGKMISDSS